MVGRLPLTRVLLKNDEGMIGFTSSESVPSESNERRTSVRYDYDLESAQEEVNLNAREVVSLNEESDASEERRSVQHGRRSGDREPQSLVQESAPTFELIVSIMEVVREPLMILDRSFIVKKANRAFYRTFGYLEEDVEEKSIYDLGIGCWRIPSLRVLLEKVILNNRAYDEVEVEVNSSHAERKTLRLNVRRLGEQDIILMSIRDVTRRRRTEVELNRVQDELRQGQKMEIVGRLAGGVAHDFNNILTGVLGFSELLLGRLVAGTDLHHYAAEIKKASERAAALTHQLLAFSRRQVLRTQKLSLDAILQDLGEMLQRLIGDNIELVYALGTGDAVICADPGQISQVILNLAINARDAMPRGGELVIQTTVAQVVGAGSMRDLPVGSYVTLTVKDSGTGMDIETQQHVFEPFFTTKPQGSGTGLGLATVFGIVKQSGAHIQFESELGCGTTFIVDFPRDEGSVINAPVQPEADSLTGTETILLVEDDELVRDLLVLLMQLQGYTVLKAVQPSQALEICRTFSSPIHLMLTDLLMPGGMDGRQLASAANELRPEMRTLLMSGYTTDALVLYGVAEGAPFLQKPFTQQQLSVKLRSVLDNQPGPV